MPAEILSRRKALSLLVVVVLAWGFTWVVSKLLLQYMTPVWAVAARSVVGTPRCWRWAWRCGALPGRSRPTSP